ncbi:hypothetical protein P4O66_009791 [Electrophorus voltai]|uniref:Uncharacterized protein n=1 Tax=Electrophorus voltai TaxID=2609070 RepID=A0AAD8ZF41_9TELE|nr:hypothetical protein P4O66_009791 [Electrophorus voltai]
MIETLISGTVIETLFSDTMIKTLSGTMIENLSSGTMVESLSVSTGILHLRVERSRPSSRPESSSDGHCHCAEDHWTLTAPLGGTFSAVTSSVKQPADSQTQPAQDITHLICHLLGDVSGPSLNGQTDLRAVSNPLH